MNCKRCGSEKIVKAGKKLLSGGPVQRYQCTKCGYVFNEKAPFQAAKEPWQMTESEFAKVIDKKIPRSNAVRFQGKEIGYIDSSTPAWKVVEDYHKGQVFQAIFGGKPVPREVLKDYPDLAKTLIIQA